MENFLAQIKDRAKKNPARLVFAEGSEARVLEAIQIIEYEGLALPLTFEDPVKDPHFEDFVQKFMALRGASEAEARSKMQNPHYFATMMVQEGLADGMIAAHGHFPSVFCRRSKSLKQKKFHKVSGFFYDFTGGCG